MLKPIIKLTLLLSLFSTLVSAQQSYLYKYIHGHKDYDLAMFHTNIKYSHWRPEADTLNLKLQKASDALDIINAGLKDKVYGISIDNKDGFGLDSALRYLKKFSNLRFLQINDMGFLALKPLRPYQLPESLTNLQQLAGIELYWTSSLDMPDAFKKISSLKNLQAFSVSGYNKPLPQFSPTLNNVTYIKLSTENLADIDVSKVKWQVIEFQGVSPKHGPDEQALLKASGIASLLTLNIEYCELGDATVLAKFTQIKDLGISNSRATAPAQICDAIGKLKSLEDLLFRIDYRDSVQHINGLAGAVNLQRLEISGLNSTRTDPRQLNSLNKLQDLRSLSVISSSIDSIIPTGWGKLKKLATLNLMGNKLTSVPKNIFNIATLQYLDLSSNRLASLPDIKSWGCKQLQKFNISYNAITALPPAITGLTSLKVLDASSNQIQNIPASGWDNLKSLQNITLSRNHISIFPGGLQQVSSLENMDISDNYIKSIPDLSGNRYRLKTLIVSNNELTQLPEHIGLYTQLETFEAVGNGLSELPASLGDCKLLKKLDVHTDSRRTTYDANKAGMSAFNTAAADKGKFNHIRSLPLGLMNDRDLSLLRLDGNPDVDAGSVFNVILAVKRPYLQADLSNCGIQSLPASAKWADMDFFDLNLSGNKLRSLPPQFASIKRFDRIEINRNPLPGNVGNMHELTSRADMKILYDEMGIDLPGFDISKSAYAIAMAERVTDFYYKNDWAKAVEIANKAIAIDSAAYGDKVRWEEIGEARFKTKDYPGTIHDMERFINKEAKVHIHIGSSLEAAESYKADAHLALGQTEKAAQTHEYFAKKYNNSTGFQEAAILYKAAGRDDKYHQLLDTALLNYQLMQGGYIKQKRTDISFTVNYAELLIIAGKPADAIKLLNSPDPKLFNKDYLPIKTYLLATANYMNNPVMFPLIKKTLADGIKANGKVNGWNFDMFNRWVDKANTDQTLKENLLALEEVAK